jgi:hypothetical protein
MKLESQENKKKFEPICFDQWRYSGNYSPEVISYIKNKSKWSKPTERAVVLELYPLKAYDLAQDLRNIFENNR